MNRARWLSLAAALVLQHILPLTHAQHSHEALHSSNNMEMEVTDMRASHHDMELNNTGTAIMPSSYFHHPEHAGIMYAHIGIMVLAWVIILPSAVMLRIGRSRVSLPCQLCFHILNGLGILVSVIYNAQTPDLYENNSHHKAGWAISIIAVVWTLMSIVTLYSDRKTDVAGQPVSQQAMAKLHRIHEGDRQGLYRWSQDSGQGTERNTDSVCTSPRANSWERQVGSMGKPYRDEDDTSERENLLDPEEHRFLPGSKLDRFLSSKILRLGSGRHMTMLRIVYIAIERFLPLLAFLALVTGVVTYSGIFRGRAIFGGLAHFIKGGIFFWYGLLTLGRWMGSFSDFGWAWNLKPGADIVGRAKARIPSAEFTESFVIFLYGASNVFLEHLGGWGKAWTPMDLEHISITILFFGGGLLGMLIESHRLRRLLNGTLTYGNDHAETAPAVWQLPKSYAHPLNPMPAVVILLLGIMMSSHHQHSAIASAVHKQWGMMFVGFALARGVTYITFWIKPPESYLPARPPSEIVASVCLTGGGIIFMASNGNTVEALERYGLDAMFVFTVTMGLTSLIMAWAVGMVAIKGWAVRRRYRLTPGSTPSTSA